jgi:hypothetical protein
VRVPLASVPGSHIGWLIGCTHRFWQLHNRCMSCLLVYLPHGQAGRWSIQLPAQTCTADAVEPSFQDSPDVPRGAYLAGSFTSLRSRLDIDLLIDATPAFPGLHFLCMLDILQVELIARTNDAPPALLVPGGMVRNDYAHLLDQAPERIRLI